MSHQTGIVASEELKAFLATVKTDGNVRLIKIGIENEELVKISHNDVVGTWEEDYDTLIIPVIEKKQPCYIFFRLDSQNNLGFEWLFIPYSPDDSEVRQKMLFAGTRTTMKLEFGGGLIVDELFGTAVGDINLNGYRRHLVGKDADAPLTIAEEELKEVKQQHLDAAVDGKANTLPGISFPIDDNAITELIRLAKKEISYVQLSIDVDKEAINLEKACDISAAELQGVIPVDKPRYNFFVFNHTHEGDNLDSIVFIYSMPGYSCSVKERMLYSSCKATLLSGLEQVLKMEIVKKLEIGVGEGGDEINAATLQEDLHPQQNLNRQKFAKPKGPGGRGAKRLIKKTDESEANGTT